MGLVILAALLGGGFLLLGRKKKGEPESPAMPRLPPGSPPTADNVAKAKEALDILAGAAVTACPDRADSIGAIVDQFDAAVSAAPGDALARARADIEAVCPELAGVPGLTKPPEITGDPIIDRVGPMGITGAETANELALLIQKAGNCGALVPELVGLFQQVHNLEVPIQIPHTGEYDIPTAAAVQTRLTAQGAGFAPQVCAFPSASPDDEDVILAQFDAFRSQAEQLHREASS